MFRGYETFCFAVVKQSVSGCRNKIETLLPDVSLCIFVEYGAFLDAVAEKGFTDVLLFVRLHIGLVAVDAVVFGSPEVAQDFGFDAFGLFLWQGVEQILDAPCQSYLAGGLEMGAGTGIGRDDLRIDGDDESPVACVLPGGQLAQAVIGFGTLRV